MKSLTALLALSLGIAAPARSAPVAFSPIGRLLADAQVVIVGTLQSQTRLGDMSILTIGAVRTIKGPATPGAIINTTWLAPPPQFSLDSLTGMTALWFLKNTNSGNNWTVLPLLTGSDVPFSSAVLRVPVEAPPLGSRVSTPEDKLLAEITATAQVPAMSKDASLFVVMRSINDLTSPLLDTFWARQLSSPDPAVSHEARVFLLKKGISEQMTAFDGTDPGALDAQSVSFLSIAICSWRSTDEAGIAALGKLSQAPYPDTLRSCAAHALSDIHTENALPFLRSLLDDVGRERRYSAVTGIAAYAAGLPVQRDTDKADVEWLRPAPGSGVPAEYLQHDPALNDFYKDEQTSISYWKTWLDKRRP